MEFDKDEWRTPVWLFDVATKQFGPFTLDVAATKENSLCASYFTKKTDALLQKWPSQCPDKLWCNPPYSNITPWLRHALECQAEVVFLLPTPNGEKRDRIIFNHATDIVFFTKRVAFLQPEGTPKKGNPRGSCLVRFKKECPKNRPRLHLYEDRD